MKRKIPISKYQLLYLQNYYHLDSKIAEILNVSVSRVCQLRKKYNIPVFNIEKHNFIRNNFVCELIKENKASKQEIAKTYGISVKTVTRIINNSQKENINVN